MRLEVRTPSAWKKFASIAELRISIGTMGSGNLSKLVERLSRHAFLPQLSWPSISWPPDLIHLNVNPKQFTGRLTRQAKK